MTHHHLTIHLLSDAEPGTGKGTEALDGLLPRNAQGLPILPAAHLKGLLRDQLAALCELRNWPAAALDALLGQPGNDGTDGRPGRLRLTDAAPTGDEAPKVLHIVRTAVGEYGTAHDGSLRTVEAIPTGTVFAAEMWVDGEADGCLDMLARLGLMSIEAVGGGRTRGAGLCRIEVDCEPRTPGELLREADRLVQAAGEKAFEYKSPKAADTPRRLAETPPRWFRLIFRAEAPVCCPEIPINGATNHVRSGPAIPASAVQGALLTRLAAADDALATACFASRNFRAWPLLPVLSGDAPAGEPVPHAVRVDLTHRMSKLPDEHDRHEVRDTALEPYHWSDIPGGAPLKSSDGILRRAADGTVTLWKAGDLPRIISSHSVHWSNEPEGRRNLFSVEALAPMVFSGLIALPAEAAEKLQEVLAADPHVAFGKARGVRGVGHLELEPVADLATVFPAGRPKQRSGSEELYGRVFVVQSPLALPDSYPVDDGDERADSASALKFLAEMAGWGKVILDDEHMGNPIARTAATCGVRFGWNRHDLGDRKANPNHKRLRARRVILPGSVLVLERPLADLPGMLLTGLGDGREQGFGALLPHPGLAVGTPYRPEPKTETLKSDAAGRQALKLFFDTDKGNGPSPSQIAAVARRLDNRDQVLKYLDQQARRGSAKHWQRWEPVFEELKTLVSGDKKFAASVLRAWQDLAIIHRSGKED